MKHVGLTGFFLLVLHVVQSQVHFRFGAEFGYSFPDRVENDLYKAGNNIFETRREYHPASVVGFATDLTFLNHFGIVTGIYYQQKQTDMHMFTIRDNHGQFGSYNMFENYSLKYHKICVPIGVGLLQKEGKLRFMLSGGMRVNFLVKGTLTYQQEISFIDPSVLRYSESEFNVIPVRREDRTRETQSFVSVSFLIFETVRVGFNYCRGVGISPKYYPSGYVRFTCNNNDYIVSASYLIKRGPEPKRIFYREGHKSVRFL